MVTVAYNAYCAISMEGDDDTCDGKTAGSRSWEVEATVNSLVGTLFHVIITRMGTDLIFLSRLGSTICFTNFGSHDPIVLYWNPWYTEPCYKGSLLYITVHISTHKQLEIHGSLFSTVVLMPWFYNTRPSVSTVLTKYSVSVSVESIPYRNITVIWNTVYNKKWHVEQNYPVIEELKTHFCVVSCAAIIRFFHFSSWKRRLMLLQK